MRFARLSVAVIGLLPLAWTAPLEKRALTQTEEFVLQLALFLERLEFNLYSGGFNNFTDEQYIAQGFPPGFRENVGVIARNEAVHIDTISQVLQSNGVTPVPPCIYKFPSTDPKSFVSLANMITTVGIGSYIGGAAPLSSNPTLLTAASAILAVEARHDAYLRAGLGASPFPTPFDTPLTAVFAYNLAQMFIVSCPQYLPIIVLPKLTLSAPTPPLNLRPPLAPGTILTFNWDPATFFVPVNPADPLFIAFVNQIGKVFFVNVNKVNERSGTVPLPSGLGNIAFAVLTTFSGGLTQEQLTTFGTLAGPTEVPIS
ncbi:hypothetical protein MMC16_006588 [Acarospora aff. strigata]|nr:hypothetical protein [Acarospora aff. strigata]